MRMIALVLALALLPTASAASGIAAVASATWGAAGVATEAAPGDTGRVLTVGLQNVDSESYLGVRATLGEAGGIAPAPGGDKASLSGIWEPGEVWSASFVVNIAEDAAAEVELPIRLTMQYASSSATLSRTVEVPVRLTGHPVLAVSSTSLTLPSFARVDLPIEVRNVGTGPAGGVSIAASATGILSIADDGVRSVGGVAANATRALNVSLLTGAPGSAALTLRLTYTDAAGAPVAETRTLALRVVDDASSPLVARLVATDLARGAPGVAEFVVENRASSPARDVTVQLRPPAGASVLGGTDSQFLGELAAGAERVVRFELRPASEGGDVLDVAVGLTWTDASGIVRASEHRDGIPVAPSAPSPLRIGLVDATLEAGRAGALGFELTNAGDTALRDVRVAFVLSPTAPFALVNATSATVAGDLAPGATTRIELPLLVSQAAADIQPLSARATWRDADGTLRAETYSFAALVRGAISITLTEGTASLAPESDAATIAGTLTNLGNAKAFNAYLRIGEGGAFEATEAQFLGDLDPNTALPFSIDTRAVRTGTDAPILLTWNDEYGAIHEQRYDTSLRPVEAPEETPREQERTPGPALPVVLGVLAVVALLAARKRR